VLAASGDLDLRFEQGERMERTADGCDSGRESTTVAAWTPDPSTGIKQESVTLVDGQKGDGGVGRGGVPFHLPNLVSTVHATELGMHDHLVSFPVRLNFHVS
jgi:hypothetical protein